MVVVMVMGEYLVKKGKMRVGDVIEFIGLEKIMIGSMEKIRELIKKKVKEREKMEELLKMEDEKEESKEKEKVEDIKEVKGDIVLENVK